MHTHHRVFDWNSQQQFALCSSDSNPVHVDPVAARRTHSGAPIVHGIHSLIWALECIADSGIPVAAFDRLKVQFPQPIYVGDNVDLEVTQLKPTLVRARMLVRGEEVLGASLELGRSAKPVLRSSDRYMLSPEQPLDLTLRDMANLNGCLSFGPSSRQLAVMFPMAAAAFGIQRLAALASTSCLVGMVAPGLHSMYSGLDVSLVNDDSAPTDALQFEIQAIVERFRLVRIAVAAQGLHGSLQTVSRMPPARQATLDELRSRVAKDEFRNCVALIVGGSRGLGELTAKLIAAGSGRIIITYAAGRKDADTLVTELTGLGATCSALPYDVRQPAAEQLAALDVVPTQLYYFATPPIFRRKSGLFDTQRFEEFNAFYLRGFFDLVQACKAMNPRGLRVFYPSSTALDERPATMTEYSMSKAAAEVLCADLSKYVPEVNVLVRRLPRLPTDQTNSVVQVQTQDPVSVMLPIVRDMHSVPG